MKISFENIEEKLAAATSKKEYEKLIGKIKKAKRIYLIGNGGLHFVSAHMSTDMTRLIPDKVVYSFDNFGFITSNANDHGFEKVFVRWLDTVTVSDVPEDSVVIGLSCSGNSTNIIEALHWADDRKMPTFLISGQKSDILRENIDELSCDCEYFHTVEVMIMMIFYDIIHQTDNRCPTIKGEKNRLKDSGLRGSSK